jgi:hypothetical protein
MALPSEQWIYLRIWMASLGIRHARSLPFRQRPRWQLFDEITLFQ